jgi:hypothetical protein
MPEMAKSAKFADMTEERLLAILDSLSEKIKSSISPGQELEYILPLKGNDSFGILMPAEKIFCPRNY